MANMVDAFCAAAMVLAVHCLSVGAAITSMLRRAVAFSTRRFVASCSASAEGLPPVGQQLFDSAVQLRRQPGKHVLEIGPRLVPIELGRLQQAHHHRSALARELAADEEPIAPPQGPRPDPVLDMVVVDRHLTVEQVPTQPDPVVQAVVDGLGRWSS